MDARRETDDNLLDDLDYDEEGGDVVPLDKPDLSTSPTDSTGSDGPGKVPGLGRRMSNVSDEERERARVYREGVLGKGRECQPSSLYFFLVSFFLLSDF